MFQNIDVVCMPSPGDFEFHDPSGGIDRDHKCYVTGWGRRTESESAIPAIGMIPIV